MKRMHSFRCFAAVVLLLAAASAQQTSNAALGSILKKMDATAANFQTTEANFVWDQYQKVVNETDTQKGKIYFRRANHETQMAADITEPEKKYVLFTDSKVQVYQPRIDQVTVYPAGKHRAEFETFLVLGFGGGGHDMLKSFEVKYLGTEKVGNIYAVKLDLVPKSQSIRNTFQHIVLWIDPARGVSVQQQLVEPSGDYRLAKYSDIELNQKIPDTVFKLKTTSKTNSL
jgi:outer membrane lipoprotein-sorting protein